MPNCTGIFEKMNHMLQQHAVKQMNEASEEEAERIKNALVEFIALGIKYKGRDIPTKELFKFIEVEGFLDADMKRNLRYVQIGNGDLTEEELIDLEREGINGVNKMVDPSGWRPVCRAMRQRNDAMFDRILSHPNFDPNLRNENAEHPATPLLIAAEHTPQYLEKLLSLSTIDADLVDKWDYSALAVVIKYHPEYLPVLLKSGKVSLNKENCNRSTPLAFTIQMGTLVEISMLLENGASVTNFAGISALMIALFTEHYEVLPLLVRYGAVLPPKYIKEQIATGSFDMDKIGPVLQQANMFTAEQLFNEFGWKA